MTDNKGSVYRFALINFNAPEGAPMCCIIQVVLERSWNKVRIDVGNVYYFVDGIFGWVFRLVGRVQIKKSWRCDCTLGNAS